MDKEDLAFAVANSTAAVVGVVELCAVLVQRGAIAADDTENVEAVMLRALRSSSVDDPFLHHRGQLRDWFARLRSTLPLQQD